MCIRNSKSSTKSGGGKGAASQPAAAEQKPVRKNTTSAAALACSGRTPEAAAGCQGWHALEGRAARWWRQCLLEVPTPNAMRELQNLLPRADHTKTYA
jgi:hypothetical protein